MTVRETTTPALADTGMRSFVVSLDQFTEIELIAALREDVSTHGDEPPSLKQATEVACNRDLAIALIQLASKAVATIGSSLPGEGA